MNSCLKKDEEECIHELFQNFSLFKYVVSAESYTELNRMYVNGHLGRLWEEVDITDFDLIIMGFTWKCWGKL